MSIDSVVWLAALRLRYLQELRIIMEGDSLTASGKVMLLERIDRVCKSIDKDLGIGGVVDG